MQMRLTVLVLSLFVVVPCLAEQQQFPASATFDVGFSPRADSLRIIMKAINEAEKSIKVAAYSFTSKPVSTALVNAHKRGVKVQAVVDAKSNKGKYSAAQFLANNGVPVRTNGRYAIMHNKFIVIDGKTLQTGSFNYSAAAANKNAENVIIIRNVQPLAAQYTKEWQKLWDEGEELKAAY
jgi:phosphatidylserine/phosphatidylglycerophosphate/cardiolipin synthase-like enzyme